MSWESPLHGIPVASEGLTWNASCHPGGDWNPEKG